MNIYIEVIEACDCRNKVIAAIPIARVDVSPSEGYDIREVARFEERLREWLQEHFPKPKNEASNGRNQANDLPGL